MSIADADVMRKRDCVEQWLEDGTTSFLGIAVLHHGFAWIDQLQPSNIYLACLPISFSFKMLVLKI